MPEWIGKSPDSAPPPRVKARVFERYGGICYLSGRKIRAGEPWQCDHIVAIINGGENKESNLAPVLVDKHREKTKADVAEKATVARKRAAHLGIKGPKRKIKSRGFAKAERQKPATSPLNKQLPPRRHVDD